MKSRYQSIKLAVILGTLFGSVMIFTTGTQFSPTSSASEGGAPTGRTGAPGETTCTSCHTQSAGNGQIAIIAPSNYVPGQTYQIQIQETTADQSRTNWGFETTSLAGTVMAGTYANTTSNTRIRAGATKSYVTQTTAGTYPGQTASATWNFSWTAPATDVGAVTFYAAGLLGDNDGGDGGDRTVTTSTVIQPQVPFVISHDFADFDADGRADPSVFRPSDGTWFVSRTTAGFLAARFGVATDKPIPADFDGDHKTDMAVWREDPVAAVFYVFQSADGTVRSEQFGQAGDNVASVGDWDGDGKADLSVYRDSAVGGQSYFYYRGSLNNPTGAVSYVPWGTTGDKPMRGDFDGDGKLDPAVFRASRWYILQSSNNQVVVDFWGLPTDKFVPGDYDGDNRTDLAVFRNGIWYIKQSSNGQTGHFYWGLATDILVPADYDGDGKTDAAVYRGGTWFIRYSGSGVMGVQSFGLSSDVAVPAAYVQ